MATRHDFTNASVDGTPGEPGEAADVIVDVDVVVVDVVVVDVASGLLEMLPVGVGLVASSALLQALKDSTAAAAPRANIDRFISPSLG